MSQKESLNSPKANNTTTDHISPTPNPELPRRSSSLQPSSPRVPSSKTNDTSVQLSDGMNGADNGEDQVADGGLDGGRKNDMDDAKEKIGEFDWEGLEGRFWARMEEFGRVEEGIMDDFAELMEVFNAWTTAGAAGEEERAGKRLRTQMAFVQQREDALEDKRSHYIKVVKAFENALALLSAT